MLLEPKILRCKARGFRVNFHRWITKAEKCPLIYFKERVRNSWYVLTQDSLYSVVAIVWNTKKKKMLMLNIIYISVCCVTLQVESYCIIICFWCCERKGHKVKKNRSYFCSGQLWSFSKKKLPEHVFNFFVKLQNIFSVIRCLSVLASIYIYIYVVCTR